jgi:signal transduction histidine kinase
LSKHAGGKVDVSEIPVAIGPAHLKRICSELIENAFAASELRTEVHEAMSSRNGEFVLTVIDRSTGLPFVAPDQARTDPGEEHRTAMGLAIARRLVELHGGKLALSGLPGGGVAATLSIPILPRRPDADR